MLSTSFRLVLPSHLHNEMIAHAQAEKPNECCGLLAGRNDRKTQVATVDHVYKLVNELASPVAYQSTPQSIFAAYKDIDRQKLDVVAVYHSHPTSLPTPSRTDLANNALGEEMIHIIISLQTQPATMKAWCLGEKAFCEVAIEHIPPV